jgi:hypothetical protein
MPTVHATVKLKHPALEQAGMPLGSKVTIIPILSTKEAVLVWKWEKTGRKIKDKWNSDKDEMIRVPDVIRPIGYFIGAEIITENGRELDDLILINLIGYRKFDEIFEKDLVN